MRHPLEGHLSHRRTAWKNLPLRAAHPPEDSVRVIPLGGLGEVGMNLMLYETRGRILVVDCGLLFPGEEHPGASYLVPDFTYLRENREKLEAVFLTHGHEDHIGALPHFLQEFDVPVYGTPLTLALVRPKLAEWNLGQAAQLKVIEAGERYEIGPFSIEPVPVTHSIIDAVSFAIGTPQGVFFHTGDFKIDPTPFGPQKIDLDRIRAVGDEGITALLSDSTNVEREGRTPSERVVSAAFQEIFEAHTGRIIVSTFSTNVDRIQQVLDVSARMGRQVVLLGRSLKSTVRAARELGHLKSAGKILTTAEQLSKLDPAQTCILTTGTQGEPFSALTRIAQGKHPSLKVGPGDMVILSARTIPGNERPISKTLNGLYGLGAQVIYERVSEVHVSGHAAQGEQREMMELTRPKFFVPIHGETRQLVRHGRLAQEAGIAPEAIFPVEDGIVLRFMGDQVLPEARVIAGPVAIDRSTKTPLSEDLLTERHYLGSHGLLAVTLRVDPRTGELMEVPRFDARGLAANGRSEEDLSGLARQAVFEYYTDGSDHESVEEAVIFGLRPYFRRNSAIIPFILPIVIEEPRSSDG